MILPCMFCRFRELTGPDSYLFREAAKNGLFFSGPATKRGGGKGLATKKKDQRSKKILEKFVWPLSSREGGCKALVTRPLKKDRFLRLP